MSLPYKGALPAGLWKVLDTAHEKGGISVQGDYARSNSTCLALAASLGWVSTISPDLTEYGKVWRVTVAGLSALQNKEHLA